jgi:hypothetical protein
MTSEGVHDMDRVLDHVPIKVEPAMNDVLTAPFTHDEVKRHFSKWFQQKLQDPTVFRLISFKGIGMFVVMISQCCIKHCTR